MRSRELPNVADNHGCMEERHPLLFQANDRASQRYTGKFQVDPPRVQITIQSTEQRSDSATGDSPNRLKACVKLRDYSSELKDTKNNPDRMC